MIEIENDPNDLAYQVLGALSGGDPYVLVKSDPDRVITSGNEDTVRLLLSKTLKALPGGTDNISDGHHTFGDLYDHRRALTAALAVCLPSWRSKQHHPDDDPMFEGGYFIVGIDLPTGTISYHYKLSHWKDFGHVRELKHAPKWDGLPPSGTVDRLLEFAHRSVRAF